MSATRKFSACRVEAEKNKPQLFDKRFEEALRKAKETPDEGRPLREFDLD